MPHPGTHIAALRILAADSPTGTGSLASALGGTAAEPLDGFLGDGVHVDAKTALRHRYACLGAIGPDLLYFMLDTSPATQLVQDYIVKYFATLRAFERYSDAMTAEWEKALKVGNDATFCNLLGFLDTATSEVMNTLSLALKTLETMLEALVSSGLGLNLLAILQSPRQQNEPPTKWWWADHLHYDRVNEFSTNLLNLAFLDPKFKGNPELQAYALGYLSHVIGDVVGHPYVNQIVGGPYRLHRWRHTLVENFVDGFVWSRTHDTVEGPNQINGDKNPKTARPWQDRVRQQAQCGSPSEASYHRARIHELIDVGSGDGFIPFIESALDSVGDLLGNITGLQKVQDDALFGLWCDMFLKALHQTYDAEPNHPTRLANGGFPVKADLAAAYATCLAVLRMQTASPIEEPTLPDFGNISDAAKKLWDDLKKDFSEALSKIHNPHLGGSFSFSSLFDFVKSVFAAAVAVVGAVLKALQDLCKLGEAISEDMVLVAFYLVKKPLWAAYTALHEVLETRAFAQPLPDTVDAHPELWQNRTNRSSMGFGYPVMEERGLPLPSGNIPPTPTTILQDQLFTSLDPMADPRIDPGKNIERDQVVVIGQDFPTTGSGEFINPANPMELLFHPADTSNQGMFGSDGPVNPTAPLAEGKARNYGGIVPNCRIALTAILAEAQKPGVTTVIPKTLLLHDYNLDGDRGLGWLNWKSVPASPPDLNKGRLQPALDVDAQLTVQLWKTSK